MSETPALKNKLSYLGSLLLLGSLIVFLSSIITVDIDLWGRLRYGSDYIQQRGVILSDPYSYMTEGQQWIDHEWLSEIIMAISWQAGGTVGLVMLSVVLCLLTGYLFYRQLNQRHVPLALTSFLILLAFCLALQDTTTIRPQIFTFLGVSLLLIIIRKAEAGHYNFIWFTPLLFVAWINLHGGVLLGIALYSVWLVYHLFGDFSAWKRLLPPFLLSLGMLFVNPYGWKLIWQLLITATVPRSEFLEWNPINFHRPLGIVYLASLTLVVVGLAYSRRRRSPVITMLMAILAVLPVEAMRFLSIFGSGMLILAGEHIHDTLNRALEVGKEKWNTLRKLEQFTLRIRYWSTEHTPFLSGLQILLALAILVAAAPHFANIKMPDTFPVPVIGLMKQSGVSGKLVTEYSWGGFALYHLAPDVKVNIDSRRETVYSPEIYAQNISFLWGYYQWDEILQKYQPEMAMLPVPSPAANLLRTQVDWEIVYQDARFILFVRRASPQAAPLRQAARSFVAPGQPWYFP